MRFLLDTQLILWAAAEPHRLPKPASEAMANAENELHYSVVSLWETTIKNGMGRPDFKIDAYRLRSQLRKNGYLELNVEAEHALLVLPRFHKDPFDRLLIAQASVEQLTLLTTDGAFARYGEHAAVLLV